MSGNNSDTCHRVRALPNEPSGPAKKRKRKARERSKNRNKKEVERKQKGKKGRKTRRDREQQGNLVSRDFGIFRTVTFDSFDF